MRWGCGVLAEVAIDTHTQDRYGRTIAFSAEPEGDKRTEFI